MAAARALLTFVLGVAAGAFAVYFFAPLPAPRTVVPSCPVCAPHDGGDSGSATITSEVPPALVATPPSPAPPPDAAVPDDAPALETPPPAPPPETALSPHGTLSIPVEGIRAEQLIDTYTQARGAGRSHDAIDIMAPAGTRVLAVDDGTIAKLFNSKPGGLTVYEFNNAQTHAYYYAHLSAYAPGIAEGQTIKRGDLVGFVGSTGNASTTAPHLHFAVFVLGPERRWWEGTAVNPFPLLGGR